MTANAHWGGCARAPIADGFPAYVIGSTAYAYQSRKGSTLPTTPDSGR